MMGWSRALPVGPLQFGKTLFSVITHTQQEVMSAALSVFGVACG